MSSHEPFDAATRARLLALARASIVHGLTHQAPLVPSLEGWDRRAISPGACFVTLHERGDLRGCVGNLNARGPLVREIARAAYSAAFRDSRFSPVEESELPLLDIHISILSEPQEMEFADEQHLVRQLRPGVDGLILTEGDKLGTFLPDVWASLREPQRFLDQLKVKAGLASDYWSDSIRVQRYATESFP